MGASRQQRIARSASAVLASGLLVLLSGCGAANSAPVHVGATALGWDAIERRAATLAQNGGDRSQAHREALAQLITAAWTLEECRAMHAPPSALTSAAAATAWLRARWSEAIAPAGIGEARRFYRSHRRLFLEPERRYFLIDNFLDPAPARALLARLRKGLSIKSTRPLHEMIERPSARRYEPEEQIARAAIFAATPGAPSGPIQDYGEHSVFVVTRVVPVRYRAFAEALDTIRQRLDAELERQALARSIAAWRARWRARTRCASGYVVPQCRSYKGSPAAEAPAALDP